MKNSPLLTISAIQEAIISEFQTLAGDRAHMLAYLMELGERLPPMNPLHKNEHNVIEGCMAMVWLTYTPQAGRLFFEGDSNTAITKGLMSLLLRVLSGQKISDIVHANLYFVGKIDMMQLIGFQRANGFAHMVKKIKLIAIAQQTK